MVASSIFSFNCTQYLLKKCVENCIIILTLSQFIGLYKLRKKAFLTMKKYKKCIFAKETYLGHPKKGGFSLHEARNS